MKTHQTARLLATDLDRVVALLNAGECVAVPTETVYGLAANALDKAACQRIFDIKGRPLIDPLIVHCKGLQAAGEYGEFNPLALRLAEAFWPGPLTLVVEKKPLIPDIVTAGMSSVALRVPAQPIMRRLLSQLNFPLAAPSANPFGYVSPTSAEHVLRTLGGRIAAVVDDGPCVHGVESTIVDVRNPLKPRLLRPGPIDRSALEAVAGCAIETNRNNTSDQKLAQLAPGSLASHYSPNATLRLHPAGALSQDKESQSAGGDFAKVHWQRPQSVKADNDFWLTENGDSVEAAHNLFALLNRLDAQGYRQIDCEFCPSDKPLADAINDRLQRAAIKAAVQ